MPKLTDLIPNPKGKTVGVLISELESKGINRNDAISIVTDFFHSLPKETHAPHCIEEISEWRDIN